MITAKEWKRKFGSYRGFDKACKLELDAKEEEKEMTKEQMNAVSELTKMLVKAQRETRTATAMLIDAKYVITSSRVKNTPAVDVPNLLKRITIFLDRP